MKGIIMQLKLLVPAVALIALSVMACLEDWKPIIDLHSNVVEQATTAKIYGTVVDSTGQPSVGTYISLENGPGKPVAEAYSDLYGNFHMSNIEPTKGYRLKAEFVGSAASIILIKSIHCCPKRAQIKLALQ